MYIKVMKLDDHLQGQTAIDHIAIAVGSIDRALPLYIALGGVAGERETVVEQGVTVLPIAFAGSRIELLEPLTENTPVGKFISRRGEGLHHIAVLVPDIRAAIANALSEGCRALDAEPRQGAEGRLIAFLDPKTTGGVLIELTQIPCK